MATFLNLAVPVQVAIITACIGAITIVVNTWIGKGNISSLKQRRYIDTISNQRIDWVNDLRDTFVELSILTTEFLILHEIHKVKSLEMNHEKNQERLAIIVKIGGSLKKTKLLLNPTEIYNKELIRRYTQLVDYLEEHDFSVEKHQKLHDDLEYIQQVILKAEWKRIITEIEMGKKLKKPKVAKIFSEVAKEVDEIQYNALNESIETIKTS